MTDQTLIDWLPSGYREATTDRLDALLGLRVVKEYEVGERGWRSWKGREKNVKFWCILENGNCVGFNENVSIGWSFPILPKSVGNTILGKK